jgi:archaellum component FlaC
MDHLSRSNNKDKRQLEQPLLGSNRGKEGSSSGMWWLYKKTSESKEAKIQSVNDSPSESKIDLPKLESKLLRSTESALKSFETISDRLKQVKGSYPLTESAHNIIKGLPERANSNNELEKDKEYIEGIVEAINRGVNILKGDIKKFSGFISKIKRDGNDLLSVVKDSNKRDSIEKLVNLPDLSVALKAIPDDIKRGDHLQLMKHYISCIDVFTNQEYKQHLSAFLGTGSSDHEGSTSH